MRVVHVNDIAHVGSTLTRALRSLGVDAELVVPRQPGAGLSYPWKLVAVPLRLAWTVASGLALRGRGADLVHVHYARLGMLGPLSGRPYVLHCHGSDIRGVTPGSFWGREAAPFLRGARRVFYSTPDLATWVLPFRRDAELLPNPIELPPAEAGPPSAFDADLLVGVRLDPVKGVDEIAETLRAVVRARPATTLTVIDQGGLVERIRSIAPERTSVVPPVAHADLPALMRRHRVLVGQLAVGAIGNYELEGLAAGRPVVSSFRYPDAYPTPPPLVAGGTADERAAAIVALLDDPGAAIRLGAEGRAWVAANHEAGAVARRLADAYASILAHRDGPGARSA